jgi:hypothetical protein
MKIYSRPYQEPEQRTFEEWCKELGLEYEGIVDVNKIIDYDSFTSMPNVKFTKIKHGDLYDWWRQYGDKWGEDRTIEEWIKDFDLDIAELEPDDLKDLNIFLGHDKFWEWSNGKLSTRAKNKKGWLNAIRKLFQ